jgi:bifunctional UDP-N-acetylglucosamine pyrophosphorylase/glucosamine-1-phosphate N-acetyltransferase
MNTQLPKVLHEVCGRPMLAYVLDACRSVGVEKIYVVVGYGAEKVKERFADATDLVWVHQAEQLGTAHAVGCCREHLQDVEGQTLVLCGDGPLIRAKTLEVLIDKHETEQAAATLATALLDDPSGYGRIIRDAEGNLKGIVEDSDCDPAQKAIQEVNPSYYLFDNQLLFSALEQIKPDNVKGEFYVTDTLAVLLAAGHKLAAVTAVQPDEAVSVNSRDQLAFAGKLLQQRIQKELMAGGVTIVDPNTTWIDNRARIGKDTIIEPFTYISGQVTIGGNCRIGPFACLRHGTEVADGAVVGAFTESQSTGKMQP